MLVPRLKRLSCPLGNYRKRDREFTNCNDRYYCHSSSRSSIGRFDHLNSRVHHLPNYTYFHCRNSAGDTNSPCNRYYIAYCNRHSIGTPNEPNRRHRYSSCDRCANSHSGPHTSSLVHGFDCLRPAHQYPLF